MAEEYIYAISYVTAEGETAHSMVATATDVEADGVVTVTLPGVTEPRVLQQRLWRNLGNDVGDPVVSTLYLLASFGPSETTYQDTERIADFTARYDSSETAPETNTTATDGTYGYGYTYGYCCYGDGCLEDAPPCQEQDPNPLPDLEAGYTPPKQFSSTKTACVSCPSGTVNVSETNLVPEMTSNTTPSGVASASNSRAQYPPFGAFNRVLPSGAVVANDTVWATEVSQLPPQHLQYRFATAATVRRYAITAGPQPFSYDNPKSWLFQGSNNGTTWTTLHFASNIVWFPLETKSFAVTTPGSYLYYRLSVSDVQTGSTAVMVAELELFGDAPQQICKTASATSETSQADADAAATAAATALAEAQLACTQQFTATKHYTASCANGCLGSPVTRSATRTSLVSQLEADAAALAAAQEEAEALLVCTGSNNNQRIDINDSPDGQPTQATPYPSTKYVSGLTGTITKVTVELKRFNHGQYADVAILLVSPSGTGVYLMGNCMDAAFDTVERTFIVDDDAAAPFPQNSRPAGSGPHTYQPTVYDGQIVPFPVPAPDPEPGPLYETTLASLIGEDPNGCWALYIVDDAHLDFGFLLTGWDLTITTA